MNERHNGADRGVRELRIALVCYGGVSLAVYMHGLTKELRKLVVASRAFEQAPDTNPFTTDQSEYAYFEQLAVLAEDGPSVRVVIDIISGTSAGGINGVCLAKALANDGSDDALRDLWLSRGDIGGLLNAPRGLPLWARIGAVVGRVAMRPAGRFTPLRGDDMARWLHDAISTMDRPDKAMTAASVSGLVPAGNRLHLYVTTTDLTGVERVVDFGTGGAAHHDRSYHHALVFRHDRGGDSDFGPGSTAALALAARCTSSFPGAFPPVRLKEFAEDLQVKAPPAGRACDLDAIVRRFFPQYLTAPEQAWSTAFVDGGVLDNAPFDHAVAAISRQRAETEVIRHLVYIEPDPPPTPPAGTADAEPSAPLDPVGAPGWLSTLWRVRTTIPWHQPLLNQLLALRDLNARIRDVDAVADHQMATVERLVEEAMRQVAPTNGTVPPAPGNGPTASMTRVADREWLKEAVAVLHGKAREATGLAYGTYARLKIEDAITILADRMAAAFAYPPDSSQAAFVHTVLIAWAKQQPAYREFTDQALQDFLGSLDLGYRERRMRFIVQGVNRLYGMAGSPSRHEIDRVKRAVWDIIDGLGAMPASAAGKVPSDIAAVIAPRSLSDAALHADPADWAAEHGRELSALVHAYRGELSAFTQDSGAALWERFLKYTETWTAEQWTPLATRYAGFPVWDTLIFPIVALSGVPQFSPVQVRRFSPLDATRLAVTSGEKLKGTGLSHFAAFFHQEWRENDYLWGRLDGVQLILGMLNELRPEPAEVGSTVLKRAFEAVLDSETALRKVEALRRDVGEQVAAMQ
ncbi:patatin-like protein [Wenjunlia tyrosinilytica]|uniref:PNPLA domain-containing protein n=1 Tax=Wenjunlia tyrosinilytica TaxID=1544741 RepID=A0A917ZVI5_9ACTN|nr:patatin-like protein [Wenjunlia tyrosinilytica]GGO94047.1 hypothetical protein GCM10012280_47970 [Wenjunlia tyrosinilytica]